MKQTHSFNYILQAKSNQFLWDGEGPLSIKTFTNGKAFHKTNRGYFSVEVGRYLLVNDGPYSIRSISLNKGSGDRFCGYASYYDLDG